MSELDATLDYARDQGMTDRDLTDLVRGEADRRRFEPPPAGSVALEHPALPDRVIHVDPEAVPVHAASGWAVVAEPEDDADGLPKGNARRADWAAYAATHGLTEDEVDAMSRDEIRDHFTQPTRADLDAAEDLTEETPE